MQLICVLIKLLIIIYLLLRFFYPYDLFNGLMQNAFLFSYSFNVLGRKLTIPLKTVTRCRFIGVSCFAKRLFQTLFEGLHYLIIGWSLLKAEG